MGASQIPSPQIGPIRTGGGGGDNDDDENELVAAAPLAWYVCCTWESLRTGGATAATSGPDAAKMRTQQMAKQTKDRTIDNDAIHGERGGSRSTRLSRSQHEAFSVVAQLPTVLSNFVTSGSLSHSHF